MSAASPSAPGLLLLIAGSLPAPEQKSCAKVEMFLSDKLRFSKGYCLGYYRRKNMANRQKKTG
jgi:hypothetical protein